MEWTCGKQGEYTHYLENLTGKDNLGDVCI
jgi:hypothetical protein